MRRERRRYDALLMRYVTRICVRCVMDMRYCESCLIVDTFAGDAMRESYAEARRSVAPAYMDNDNGAKHPPRSCCPSPSATLIDPGLVGS